MPFGQAVSNLPGFSFTGPGRDPFSDLGHGSLIPGAARDLIDIFTDVRDLFRPGPSFSPPRTQPAPPLKLPGMPSLPPGSTGTNGPVFGPATGGAACPTRGPAFAQAQGLFHITPCGNFASNAVIFETDPRGGLHAGMVKKISMSKLRRSIMAQVRSSPRRARRHHHHHHGGHHHRRPC